MTVLVWLSFIMSAAALAGVVLVLSLWNIDDKAITRIYADLHSITEIAKLLNKRIDELQKEVKKDNGRG